MSKVVFFRVMLFVLSTVSLSGQVIINGVADKSVYVDTVTFTISPQAGYTYSAFLNANTVGIGPAITVSQPDYYELRVTSTQTSSGSSTTTLVRFIVRDSSRGETEQGLPPQVPWPVIPSSPDEFAGSQLRLLAPDRFPTGYEIPIVAWVEDSAGHAVRANGEVMTAGHPSFKVRRGAGSGFLGATNAAGTLVYSPSIQGLPGSKTIELEGNTTWSSVSGILSGNTSWPDNSRIFLSANLTVPAGVTLTVGAGTIIRINPRTDITNYGNVVINGTRQQPVVFMPNSRSQPWGGFIMGGGTGAVQGTGVIFTGSGAVASWFGANGNPTSHRSEQALFFVPQNHSVSLTDSAAIYLAGQLGHATNGGSFAFDHFLAQRLTTAGEFTGSTWVVNDSAFIEVPDDSINFVDGDNDAIYFVSGSQSFTNTLLGWTKDDAIDCGGSGYGTINFQSCWFESVFHEGNALSGFKNVFARDSVYLGCGQGHEDGYDSPTGHLDHCFLSANQIGLRYGDNYRDSYVYNGNASATNSILLHNHHDIFAHNWNGNGWTQAIGKIVANGNWLTAADTNYPNNFVWDPANDGPKLAAFGGKSRVGAGLAVWPGASSLATFPKGIPVGLSIFATRDVSVAYSVLGTDGTSMSGTLDFPAGKTRDFIPLPANFTGVLRVSLDGAVNADITGVRTLLFQNLSSPPVTNFTVLSPLGAVWKYLDDGSDQNTAWQGTNFNDSTWASGPGRLGFGTDASATTTIRKFLSGTSGPQITNYYFRRSIIVTNPADFETIQFRYQRDDGCVLYLNGNELFRNNMPSGPITYRTFATNTVSPATETLRFWTNSFSSSLLKQGTNVIAVEVHQSTATSSDIAWDMELQGLPAQPRPRVNIARMGTDAVLYWSDPTFQLEQEDVLNGQWNPAANSSPKATPLTGNQFFRLKK
jgi:hypothetical protein